MHTGLETGPCVFLSCTRVRVLHVITTLDPNHGGPPAVALRIAAAQAAAGHRVEILAYHTPGGEDRIARSIATIPGIAALTMHRVTMHGAAERWLGRGAAGAVRTRLSQIDFVHLHGVWDTILRVGASESRKVGRPYAVTPHGMLDPWCLGATPFKRLKKHAALAVAYRRMLNNAAFLHVLNRDEQSLMSPLGLRPPTVVVPNGVFIEEFADLPPRDAYAAGRHELGGRPFLLFLSRVHHKKGLDLLAEGFARVAPEYPDLHLVVAGPDDGALAPLRAQAESLGIAARVHAVGPLYGREKLAALTGAAALCLTSRQEGFSMAVTEAMAARVPVIVSDQCHFPEVSASGAGYVVPLDPAAIAHAIRGVMASPEHRESMGAAGRSLVESRFTWPAIAASLCESYARHSKTA